jgi:hypothetical protein
LLESRLQTTSSSDAYGPTSSNTKLQMTTAITAVSNLTEKGLKDRIIRKPLRAIAKDLAERVKKLGGGKGDEWEKFILDIEMYRAEEAAERPHNPVDIPYSIKLFNSVQHTQKLDQKALNASKRRAYVIATGAEQEATRIRVIEARIAGKDASYPGIKNSNVLPIGHRWYLASALAAKLAIVKAFLEEKHRMGAIYKVEAESAMTIQRRWRHYSDTKRQAVVHIAFGVISKLILRVCALFLPLRLSTHAE